MLMGDEVQADGFCVSEWTVQMRLVALIEWLLVPVAE